MPSNSNSLSHEDFQKLLALRQDTIAKLISGISQAEEVQLEIEEYSKGMLLASKHGAFIGDTYLTPAQTKLFLDISTLEQIDFINNPQYRLDYLARDFTLSAGSMPWLDNLRENLEIAKKNITDVYKYFTIAADLASEYSELLQFMNFAPDEMQESLANPEKSEQSMNTLLIALKEIDPDGEHATTHKLGARVRQSRRDVTAVQLTSVKIADCLEKKSILSHQETVIKRESTRFYSAVLPSGGDSNQYVNSLLEMVKKLEKKAFGKKDKTSTMVAKQKLADIDAQIRIAMQTLADTGIPMTIGGETPSAICMTFCNQLISLQEEMKKEIISASAQIAPLLDERRAALQFASEHLNIPLQRNQAAPIILEFNALQESFEWSDTAAAKMSEMAKAALKEFDTLNTVVSNLDIAKGSEAGFYKLKEHAGVATIDLTKPSPYLTLS
ncbi:hypothetical protein FACS189425_01490 [Clostridia bacterium]|nr:hypothetical protein FACS189425_01490 [Clostridia bacterium]